MCCSGAGTGAGAPPLIQSFSLEERRLRLGAINQEEANGLYINSIKIRVNYSKKISSPRIAPFFFFVFGDPPNTNRGMQAATQRQAQAPQPSAVSVSDDGSITSRVFARIGLLGNPSDGFFGKTISLSLANFYAEVCVVCVVVLVFSAGAICGCYFPWLRYRAAGGSVCPASVGGDAFRRRRSGGAARLRCCCCARGCTRLRAPVHQTHARALLPTQKR